MGVDLLADAEHKNPGAIGGKGIDLFHDRRRLGLADRRLAVGEEYDREGAVLIGPHFQGGLQAAVDIGAAAGFEILYVAEGFPS